MKTRKGLHLYQSRDEFDPPCDVYKNYDKEEHVLLNRQ